VDLFDVVGDLAGIGEGLCGLWMLASGQQSGDGVLTDLETLANDRVVQWVEVSSGASWQVTRTISATVPLGKAGLRPRPFAITPTPSAPFSANRARHRRTVSESTSHRRAISWLARPCAAHSKALAWTTVRCGDVAEAAIVCSWARCVWVTGNAGAVITDITQCFRTVS